MTEESSIRQPENLCRWCKEKFNTNASVCKVCHKHQNWFLGWLPQFATLASIIAVILTFAQWQAASKEAIRAEEAMGQAATAQINAIEALKNTKVIESNISKSYRSNLENLITSNKQLHQLSIVLLNEEQDEIEKNTDNPGLRTFSGLRGVANAIKKQAKAWEEELEQL